LLPRTPAPALASTIRSISSLHGPVAFTTTRAYTVVVAPSSTSATVAPATRPSRRTSPATATWLSVTAPARCADNTVASVSRTSSVAASQYRAPPISASVRSAGSLACTAGASSRTWRWLRNSDSTSYSISPAPSFQRGTRAPRYTGQVNASGRTRWGAMRCKVRRSRLDSKTSPSSPCSR
jgi:hypothetical protein